MVTIAVEGYSNRLFGTDEDGQRSGAGEAGDASEKGLESDFNVSNVQFPRGSNIISAPRLLTRPPSPFDASARLHSFRPLPLEPHTVFTSSLSNCGLSHHSFARWPHILLPRLHSGPASPCGPPSYPSSSFSPSSRLSPKPRSAARPSCARRAAVPSTATAATRPLTAGQAA